MSEAATTPPQDAAASPDPSMERLAEKLRPLHDAAGVTQPDEAAKAAPSVFVGSEKSRPPPYKLADELGKLLAADPGVTVAR